MIARWVRLLALSLVLTVVGTTCTAEAPAPVATPPKAAPSPREIVTHGVKRVDEYHWLQRRDDPKVVAHLKAENDYADQVMESTLDLQDELLEEILDRLQENDTNVPARLGNYYYYDRTEDDEDYAIHCRKRGNLLADEEVILNENDLARGHNYFSLGLLSLSPNQKYVALAIDTDGTERYTLRFKDLATGRVSHESIANVTTSIGWGADDRTVFYAVLDAAARPHRVYRHVIGDDVQRDVLVHEEKDDAVYVYPSNTKSREFLLLSLERNSAVAETRVLAANNPTGEFQVIRPRAPGLEYHVDHHGDQFLIVTNDGATENRLMTAPVGDPGKWRELVPHRPDVYLDTIEVFREHIALVERAGGRPRFSIREMATGKTSTLAFDEPDYSLELGDNLDYDSPVLRVVYSSYLTPDTTYDVDLKTLQREVKKRDQVVGEYDPADYEVKSLPVDVGGGTTVALSVVYRKGLKLDGQNPCLLYGYGAYGISEDPYFNSALLSLLDRGFVYAVAHVRGGGERGRAWYDAGRLLNKNNSFTDFIACAEYLIAHQYTSPRKLAISGASAGGLLIGAVINMRPDLFAAAVADVPFVDVLNTMLDPSLPLTVTEYQEWGDPNDKTYFDYIARYSPYDNVRRQAYPHLLIRASLNDTRVSYWEAAKWAARLRAMKTDDRPLVLKVNLDAGHNGASGLSGGVDELAFEYAFLLDRLGVKSERKESLEKP